MKNLLYTLTFIITANYTFAQNTSPTIIIPMANYDYTQYQQDCYIYDAENKLDFWEGTWEYTNGSTSFKLVLEKVEMYHVVLPNGDSYYIDELFGGYVYTENGVEVTNQLTFDSSVFPTTPIDAGIVNYEQNNNILILFDDIIDDSKGTAYLKLLPNSTTQATWTLRYREPYDNNFSVPNDLILTKL